MEKLLDKRNTIILVGLLALWRLYLSAELHLHPDEAYYWLWSRHLDISYFDHPPMVAYFIWLTTLVSKSELWVRLPGTVVVLVASGVIWRLAMQMFKSVQVAAGSVLLFNAYPLTMLALMVMTPDVPVFLFWSLGVYLFWQTVHSHKTWLWYLLGVTFGLALLSKYTAILMVPCFFIYLALSDDRHWLKTRYPYLAVLIGFTCFLPVVYWNSQHHWGSFAMQFRNGLGGDSYGFDKVAEYIGGQVLITGPVVWLLGVYVGLVGIFRRDKATLFLIATSLPVVAIFGVTSFRKAAGPNWPAFAYVTFSLLVAQYCLRGNSRLRRALWWAAMLSSLTLTAIVTLHARFNVLHLGQYSKALAVADATNWFHGWRELGVELKKYPGKVYAITPSHQLSAEIIYYSGETIMAQTARGTRTSQFNYWNWPAGLDAKDALYVWTDGDDNDAYRSYFASTPDARALPIERDGNVARSYFIVPGQNGVAPPFLGN
jgi:4-amino-4-deoxy-L-arabinose transferase-like glycosyltransferase